MGSGSPTQIVGLGWSALTQHPLPSPGFSATSRSWLYNNPLRWNAGGVRL